MVKGKVVIVGSGIVGRSWALIFSRAEHDVVFYDIKQSQLDAGVEGYKEQLDTVREAGLLWGQSPDEVSAHLSTSTSLVDAVKDAVYIQECVPENKDLKRKVYASIDQALSEAGNSTAIIASSSSNMGASLFADHMKMRANVLVAHPINPPFAIPVVEIVPAPFTAPEIVGKTRALLTDAGQVPVVLTKEVDGFLVNRLQYALLAEAFRLVQDGIASPEDIDSTISQGLALRWSFMGPFQTIDLNAPDGVEDYCNRYASSIYRVIKTQDNNVEWTQETIDTISNALRAEVPKENLSQRVAWRNKRLINLAIHKKAEAERDAGASQAKSGISALGLGGLQVLGAAFCVAIGFAIGSSRK